MGDLLYNFTQWLYSTPLNQFAQSMSESALSLWIVERFWAIPIMQVTHILGIAGSFAAVLMLNMRVFNLAGHATLAETSARYTKVLWWSLAVIILSGGLMLFGDTVRNLLNSIFWIKMVLVVTAVLLALGFARGLRRQSAVNDRVSGGTKALAIFLVVLWCVIMLCGRWIAYAPS
ncbi:hypothetical protein KK137_08890 [Croceibacterium sp. LX-88]|jgi:hypothetical protein|uniref:DUF6644 domain-containing protein n=1 Tax=Croceibacterium selenioxidans TaxID=2838833 RepID=A0ABS5W4M1_9SPHN|nr:DUF6644 family protein [Croceibacterium selenioxidans]MBT2134446.1 hypothetical protein [Croceibacterium selenioxidans]